MIQSQKQTSHWLHRSEHDTPFGLNQADMFFLNTLLPYQQRNAIFFFKSINKLSFLLYFRDNDFNRRRKTNCSPRSRKIGLWFRGISQHREHVGASLPVLRNPTQQGSDGQPSQKTTQKQGEIGSKLLTCTCNQALTLYFQCEKQIPMDSAQSEAICQPLRILMKGLEELICI